MRFPVFSDHLRHIDVGIFTLAQSTNPVQQPRDLLPAAILCCEDLLLGETLQQTTAALTCGFRPSVESLQ